MTHHCASEAAGRIGRFACFPAAAGAPANSMQTGSIGVNERPDRAGETGRSGHACRGMPLRSIHGRHCRVPTGRIGRRARCRSAAPVGCRSPIVPQIVLHVAGNTRRFCVLSGAERCAHDFLP
ncbi:hypothetical protein [Burkholderia seminalis]|uniref:hypothetical protein n=1 Tax=Burkholderia seminalis TaxID=488731 RepID=UPI00158B7493|nr:hypothetical protein [Burkholderia seminalis]